MILLNDVHSGLNPTLVTGVEAPKCLDDLRRLVADATRCGRRLSIGGGRHAMGGQQFASGAVHVDTRGLNRLLSLDAERGLATVEGGIDWPTLIEAYTLEQTRRYGTVAWGIRQKQTGADRLTLGGSLSANVHGRSLHSPPIVADVERFELVSPEGELIPCDRSTNADLFGAAIGGYGLFGPIATVTLRLSPRVMLRRVVRVIDIEDAVEAARRRIAEGFTFGDFQFDIDPESESFLTKGVFSCYRPLERPAPTSESRRELSRDDWLALLELAHSRRREAFTRYAQHYLATDGQTYWSDEHQLADYIEGYHATLDERRADGRRGGEMIGELYVPHERLIEFLRASARLLHERGAEVIYGTIRLIRRDADTMLPWARDDLACVIFNLHVDHDRESIQRAGDSFRALIDEALRRGGSFYLTYHRWARRDQLLAAYPRLPEFLALKDLHDPRGTFDSDWHRWLRGMIRDSDRG